MVDRDTLNQIRDLYNNFFSDPSMTAEEVLAQFVEIIKNAPPCLRYNCRNMFRDRSSKLIRADMPELGRVLPASPADQSRSAATSSNGARQSAFPQCGLQDRVTPMVFIVLFVFIGSVLWTIVFSPTKTLPIFPRRIFGRPLWGWPNMSGCGARRAG